MPARRSAPRLLHRDAGRQSQGACSSSCSSIPFWTSFLIRTYAWLLILGPDGGSAGIIGDLIGNAGFRILGTPFAVLIGLVYGYLPLMVFPLYVTLERMDRTLIEASKDLGAGRWRPSGRSRCPSRCRAS